MVGEEKTADANKRTKGSPVTEGEALGGRTQRKKDNE